MDGEAGTEGLPACGQQAGAYPSQKGPSSKPRHGAAGGSFLSGGQRTPPPYTAGVIFSMPSMYGRNACGTFTVPSGFWLSSSTGMRIRGLAITVLFSVWQ